MADKTTPKPRRKPSPVKNGYLILYNAVSAVLWLTVLGRVVGVNVVRGPHFAYLSVGEFCKWTQTLAGMEVLHSIFGKPALSHRIFISSASIPPRESVCLSCLGAQWDVLEPGLWKQSPAPKPITILREYSIDHHHHHHVEPNIRRGENGQF